MTDSKQPIAEDEPPGAGEIAQVGPAQAVTHRTRREDLEEDKIPGSYTSAVIPSPTPPPTHEDWTRRVIAWGLLGIIAVLAGAGTWAFVADPTFKGQDLEKLAVFISPLIALASASFGFYFGAGERGSDKARKR
ncbi:hypothetical protein IPZ61_04345 [Streptomyces sioyaensis]|uniref:holin family protein n=1 Tax=Streptomyces sioyaensis TaxID=67364 RepID=UPI001F2E2690|nr:holin family protein [Streptomyces sioyaensis]MCF3172546.1 hypothetical protein [Streptomyces sioyaensis]